jgi:cystathionine beta-lyase/cystathionine gamma-synthase
MASEKWPGPDDGARRLSRDDRYGDWRDDPDDHDARGGRPNRLPAGAPHPPAHHPGSLVLRSAPPPPRRPGENTRAVHLPPPPVPSQAPIATPIYRTAAFAFRSSAEHASVLADHTPGFSYSRIDNPTVEAFCAAVAALEGVNLSYQVTAQAFASGMAAISTVFWAFTKAGARVLAPAAVYGGSYGFLRSVAARFGVLTDFVDMTDLGQVRAALRPGTAIVYAETLANPTVAVADIAGLAALAHEAGALLVVDSTLAPPVICRPLEHGADLVLHSATKYFGGHSDVTGGVVTGHPELIKAVRLTRIDTGGSLASDEAYLLRRGLETLPLRVRRQCATAQVLAASLARHPAVRTVYYPGLAQHPGHQIARRQFDAGPEGTRFGAIVTVAPYGGHEAGLAFADRLRLSRTASSLGGTITKVSHVASTTHRQMDHAALAAAGIDPGSVRFSIGLEDGEDLLADAIAALDSLGRDGRLAGRSRLAWHRSAGHGGTRRLQRLDGRSGNRGQRAQDQSRGRVRRPRPRARDLLPGRRQRLEGPRSGHL